MNENRWLFENLMLRKTTTHVALFTIPPNSLPDSHLAVIYLQFHADPSGEWRCLGALGGGKESAIFKVAVPGGVGEMEGVLMASIGVALQPVDAANGALALVPRGVESTQNAPLAGTVLRLARGLLSRFVTHVLSYSRTFAETGTEAYVPERVVTDWHTAMRHRAETDPDGFVSRLLDPEQK